MEIVTRISVATLADQKGRHHKQIKWMNPKLVKDLQILDNKLCWLPGPIDMLEQKPVFSAGKLGTLEYKQLRPSGNLKMRQFEPV